MKLEGKIRGVNLGGWLVLEKWMTPTLFEGLKAEDETDFVKELGEAAADKLKEHYETWMTEADFAWIKDVGLNSVRIPVGHWVFGDVPPYVGAIDYLDKALDLAAKYELGVLIDFHAAPGSQNGFDNGGILGVLSWHEHPENIEKSVQFIERIAKRYANHEALWGLQLLNEPHWEIPMEIVQDYYIRSYEVARRHLSQDIVIMMHDSFRLDEWESFFSVNKFENVILDTHQYQCFRGGDESKNIVTHLMETLTDRQQNIEAVAKYVDVCVGEWSLGLIPQCLSDLTPYQQEHLAQTLYGHAQVLSNEVSAGWYFWSYKLEDGIMQHWNFKTCVEKGWLPKTYK